jgi:hypothetical protein
LRPTGADKDYFYSTTSWISVSQQRENMAKLDAKIGISPFGKPGASEEGSTSTGAFLQSEAKWMHWLFNGAVKHLSRSSHWPSTEWIIHFSKCKQFNSECASLILHQRSAEERSTHTAWIVPHCCNLTTADTFRKTVNGRVAQVRALQDRMHALRSVSLSNVIILYVFYWKCFFNTCVLWNLGSAWISKTPLRDLRPVLYVCHKRVHEWPQ